MSLKLVKLWVQTLLNIVRVEQVKVNVTKYITQNVYDKVTQFTFKDACIVRLYVLSGKNVSAIQHSIQVLPKHNRSIITSNK